MKQSFFCVLLCIGACAAEAYELPSATGAHHMDFSADEAQFNEYSRIINLKGNARLKELSPSGKTLKIIRAVEMSVNMSSRTAVAPGDFVMDDDTSTIYGKSGVFEYGQNSGHVTGGRLAYKNFIFRGARIEFNERRYLYRKASITSCDEEPPHYRIRASRIYMAPGRYFLAYNTVFFLGRVPLFYFPVLYRPLGGGTPFTSSFRPGYDDRNGFYVKSNFVYKFNPNTRGKLFLDYFDKKGLGTGAEADYRKPEKNISNLSVYRIREYGAGKDRWGLNGGYWHSFNRFSESDPARYYSQAFFRLLSDPEFNNDFFRTNPFAVSPDKQASLAFTRQSNYTVTRLSAYRRDERSVSDPRKFNRAYEASPRLDFNTVPFGVPGFPVLNSFSGYFENVSSTAAPYYQKNGRGIWTMSKPVPFSRNIILSPSLFYDQSLFMSTSSVTHDRWVGRYGTNVNLRYDRLWGALDLRYSYQRRMKTNHLGPDRKAADRGEEAKTVYSQLFIMPRRDIYFKAQTSYDLRSSSHSVFSKRLAPLISEFYYSPRPGLDMYLEDSYIFGEGNRSFIAQVNIGNELNYLHSGLANYNSDPSVYVFNQTLGFKPRADARWRVEGILRFKTVPAGFIRFSEFRFFEKSLILYREFHDFRTRWEVRTRTGAKELSFLISLKMNDPAVKDDLDADSRRFWHPWRKEGEIRD